MAMIGYSLGLVVAIGAVSPARAQSTGTFKGVDLYRSDAVNLEQIVDAVSPQMEHYIKLRGERRKAGLRTAEAVKGRIEAALRELGDFAYAKMHYGEYFTSASRTGYITFDLVDSKDAGVRMPFRKAGSQASRDPEGLIAAWWAYSEAGKALRLQGLIPLDRPSCPAYYCLWGSLTPDLEASERMFVQKASPQKAALKEVLEKDILPSNRAAAVYLLSYVPEPNTALGAAYSALLDPDETVRAAGLQVLADVAVYHKDVPLDLGKIIPVLDYPGTLDRSRALEVLSGVADNEGYRESLIRRAGPRILALLQLNQPANHDRAFTLLVILSKESFDRRDFKAWEAWLRSRG